MQFTTQPLHTIIEQLKEALKKAPSVTFKVLDPDLGRGYAGTAVTIEGTTYLYRSFSSWCTLAEQLSCRICTPQKVQPPLVSITFEKRQPDSFHTQKVTDKTEKYGISSTFWQINKLEEPDFLFYFQQALEHVNIHKRERVLDLGVHRADELLAIASMLDPETFEKMAFVGIDHAQSAVKEAKRRFNTPNKTFLVADINQLEPLNLGRFDLLISIGTLQSPGIAYKKLLMDLVQHYLYKEESAIILGFPNCRWIDGDLCYGAKVPHYNMSELGLLWSDVMFAKKYLQQHKYRVTITGRSYIFVTATKIGGSVKEK